MMKNIIAVFISGQIRRKLYSDKFEIHTLELPKLAKHDYPETELLKWLQFINAETEEEFEMAAEKVNTLRRHMRI